MKGLIRFCYSKTIDVSSVGWEKLVYEDTYKEFIMQAQQFDQQKRFDTFQQIIDNSPKAAAMHYLVSTAAIGYIRQLNGRIPDALDSSGKQNLEFKNFKFEILQSSVSNKSMHKVAIYFFSEIITWIDTIGDKVLLSNGDQFESIAGGIGIETYTMALVQGLSVSSFQSIPGTVLA